MWIALLLGLVVGGCTSTVTPQEPRPLQRGTPPALDPIALFVSPAGNDSFAALERARGAAREMLAGPACEDGLTIYLRGGRYELTGTLELTSRDSGTPGSPVRWQAFPGEQVVISGGVDLDDWNGVDDPEVRRRLRPKARSRVLQTTLPPGVDLGNLHPAAGNRVEVYFQNALLEVARYPNDGWLRIASVPQEGKLANPGLDRDTSAIPRGRHYGRFTYPGNRPSGWESTGDLWVHGYWTWDWSEQYLRVQRLDTATREIWPRTPHHSYGYTTGQPFRFLNVLEELDQPGEWYLDSESRTLYLWPPRLPRPGDVVLSVLAKPLLRMQDTRYIEIRGITFEGTRNEAIVIEGGEGNRIVGCKIRNTGGLAVAVRGGRQNGVAACTIHDVGAAGIQISGGDRRTLDPAYNYATSNHISRYAQRRRTYQPAIDLSGVGNLVDHNLIHDAPHLGVRIRGNDHVLEYNEVHHIALETGDVGAFYLGRDWTERGTVIRYNYFHHLAGPGLHGVMAVYLDDAASGTEVYGNLFWEAGRGVLLGGGRDNTVENNVFVDCLPAVSMDARGLGWASMYIAPDGGWRMYQKLALMDHLEPPYSDRYPALAGILDGNPAVPEGNTIRGNICVGGRWLDMDSRIPDGAVIVMDNYVGRDPGFIDARAGDFRLRAGASVLSQGFVPLPLDHVGPQAP